MNLKKMELYNNKQKGRNNMKKDYYKLEIVDQDGNVEFIWDGSKDELIKLAKDMTYDEAISFFDDFCSLINGESIEIWVSRNGWEDIDPVVVFTQEKTGLYRWQNGDLEKLTDSLGREL